VKLAIGLLLGNVLSYLAVGFVLNDFGYLSGIRGWAPESRVIYMMVVILACIVCVKLIDLVEEEL
jgi:hypothetical protein